MKTFKQFQEETQQLDEALPALIPAALKLGGMALSGLSALSAANNLRKGKFKKAAFDAIGAVPGGKVFKVAKGLGATKNLARAASAGQSLARYGTDNVYSRGVNKAFELGTKGVTGAYNKGKKLLTKNKKAPQTKIAKDPNTKPVDQISKDMEKYVADRKIKGGPKKVEYTG